MVESSTAAPGPRHASHAIPIALNEAGLDSPTFRASSIYFSEQIEVVERWLEDFVKSTSKLARDILSLEESINSYISKTFPPAVATASAADSIIDHDYTLLALRRASDGSREWWTQVMSTMRKLDSVSAEPVRLFLAGEMKAFKEVRKTLDQTQRHFDQTLARYVAQSKTKEPSALREDAFAVFEARKAYLASSLDFCQLAPQVRSSLDKLLVRISADLWDEVRRSREAATSSVRWGNEMDRIRGWSKEMEATEGIFKRELHRARRDVSHGMLQAWKPSRELEDYNSSTVPFLGSKGPVNLPTEDGAALVSEKQGWLFKRSVYGKPARTSWVRRWYYCRDGIFGWLIQGAHGVLQGDEIGVLLCNVKPAFSEDRRFCFEVKTKSHTIVLQAETQQELTEWLEVFDVAKKRAFEASVDRDNALGLPSSQDPAFNITPAPVPELSAKAPDAQQASADELTGSLDRVSTLPVYGAEGNLATRSSFDVNGGAGGRRSITALGRDLGRDLVREEGESGREHAARIIQKLDLHRKATFGGDHSEPKSAANLSPSASGISGLMSAAGYGLLGYPSSATAQGSGRVAQTATFPPLEAYRGSLAPATLAKTPMSTPLSRTAVFVTGDKGLCVDASSHMPASVMANYWGSNPWGALYGTDHGSSPRTPAPLEENPMVVTEVGTPEEEEQQEQEQQHRKPSIHRKTVSVDAKVAQRTLQPRQQVETFPPGYPSDLKAQHPIFRLLFPRAPLDDKLVLVFIAAWMSSGPDSSSRGDFAGNGSIFVTPDNIYFYGHQLGVVVTYTLSLDVIAGVTASPGRDCDSIILHLKSGSSNETGYDNITIKVFLGNLSLLHARLNLLVDDLQAEEPMTLDELVTALTNLEHEDHVLRSPSVGSWEETTPSSPIAGSGAVSARRPTRPHIVGPGLHVGRHVVRPSRKFQLPAHPVVFEPDDMKRKVAERNFELSAKACFHVLFGDKSFVFPKLYFDRRAQRIAQGPWTTGEHGRMQRDFKFRVDYTDVLGRAKSADVVDHQTIEVFEDHVTYVVTHVKTAWHLPHSQYLKLVVKVVVTYVAKSKCKLAIYTRVDWTKTPALSWRLVERQALEDARSDAEELAELATDQVRKLGPHSRTKRAIQVYGHIGQQKQVMVFSPGESDAATAKGQVIKPRTLTAMLLETARSFGESAVTSVIMWSFAALKKAFTVLTEHRLLFLLLGLSLATNLLWASREASMWWSERRAAQFMNRIGVGPNTVMSRAIYLADLPDATGATEHHQFGDSACYAAFQQLTNTTNMDAPYENIRTAFSTDWGQAAAQRIRQTRQRLGSYRHDLVVAMRVVNSIEREMMESEWEVWLTDETARCNQLKMVLGRDEGGEHRGKKGGDKTKKGQEEDQKVMFPEMDFSEDQNESERRTAALRAWHQSYCGSSLSPADWASISPEKLPDLLAETFADAQTIIDSLPVPSPLLKANGPTSSTRRTRSNTDPATLSTAINRSLSPRQSGASLKLAQDLMKEWREVKVNARENPLSINVYKLPAKDGKGAWFARRSVHDGLPFEKWKLGLEREFVESMKVQDGPGAGCIRGIGADKRVEHHVVDGAGKVEVFQLSAQFPGPTTPRDFVILLLTGEASHNPPTSPSSAGSGRPLRSFMVVSKPCNHPDYPPCDGCIRGQYESVEVIREIPSDKPVIRRSRSSIDLGTDTDRRRSIVEDVGKQAVLRAARHGAEPQEDADGASRDLPAASMGSDHVRRDAIHHLDDATADEDEAPTTIEWLMVTRSDPGGNVPRFMVERGTPGGIASDANKFLKWLTSKSARDFASNAEHEHAESDRAKTDAVHAEETESHGKSLALDPTSNLIPEEDDDGDTSGESHGPHEPDDYDAAPNRSGIYGMISGAFGMASSLVAARLPNSLPGFSQNGNDTSSETVSEGENDEVDGSMDDQSDTSSLRSFTSAVESSHVVRFDDNSNGSSARVGSVTDDRRGRDDANSIQSNSNDSSPSSTSKLTHDSAQYEKEARKLEDRREKMHEKLARLQSRITAKREEGSQRDAATLAKLREKHEREMAKHEEKYRRELRRLEEKRESEERKAEQRRRKQAEREEKADMGLELQRVRAERDLALKQVEALTAQVGELQAQNTNLVAEMGRMNTASSPMRQRDPPGAATGSPRTAERQPVQGVRRAATSL
ncbi:hypothetical protein ACRALDRAFT_1077851 [Sodiomyces alcalophilus JCM 7366]|uniref:uncharacterized protein n=1 Tax=Sodiomyces alcalophilus JCM 7366 TaxID=591952 RepID=UPI0039B4280A